MKKMTVTTAEEIHFFNQPTLSKLRHFFFFCVAYIMCNFDLSNAELHNEIPLPFSLQELISTFCDTYNLLCYSFNLHVE